MDVIEALDQTFDQIHRTVEIYRNRPPSEETVAVLNALERRVALLQGSGITASAGLPIGRAARMAQRQ